MKRLITSLILLSALLAGCGNGISDQDREFMRLAGSAGMMEVAIGKMAVARGTRADVKEYGKEMVDSHTSFNNDFHVMLKKIGETVPDTMNTGDQAKVASLQKVSDKDFDNAYIDIVYLDHKMAVDLFKQAIAQAKNSDYKAFLEKGLVIVTHHFEMAEKLKGTTAD